MRMRSDPTKLKTLLTVVLLLSGAGLTVVLVNNTKSASAYQSTSIAIDLGYCDVQWVDADFKEYDDPIKILEYACNAVGYELVIEDNKVTEINGIPNDEEKTWNFWVVKTEELNWTKLVDTDVDISEYSVSTWAFCGENEAPTVGVDQFGRSIYGYPQAKKIVTLSPSITEILGSLNAANAIVGADK